MGRTHIENEGGKIDEHGKQKRLVQGEEED